MPSEFIGTEEMTSQLIYLGTETGRVITFDSNGKFVVTDIDIVAFYDLAGLGIVDVESFASSQSMGVCIFDAYCHTGYILGQCCILPHCSQSWNRHYSQNTNNENYKNKFHHTESRSLLFIIFQTAVPPFSFCLDYSIVCNAKNRQPII